VYKKYFSKIPADLVEDLFGFGYVGLINAIDDYDASKGKLEKYIFVCVKNAMSLAAKEDYEWPFRIPRSTERKFKKPGMKSSEIEKAKNLIHGKVGIETVEPYKEDHRNLSDKEIKRILHEVLNCKEIRVNDLIIINSGRIGLQHRRKRILQFIKENYPHLN
jgi:hypothetical protein